MYFRKKSQSVYENSILTTVKTGANRGETQSHNTNLLHQWSVCW